MKLESMAQAVLAALLVAAITGGLVLWADLRTLRTATIPSLERSIAGLESTIKAQHVALEAHTVALAVLDARSQKEGRAHGRLYGRVE